MNAVATYTRRSWPGGSLTLTEPVKVGDILRVGDEQPFHVHVVWVRGTNPCEVMIGNPYPYAGLDSIPRNVMAGEPVEVVGRYVGRQEQP